MSIDVVTNHAVPTALLCIHRLHTTRAPLHVLPLRHRAAHRQLAHAVLQLHTLPHQSIIHAQHRQHRCSCGMGHLQPRMRVVYMPYDGSTCRRRCLPSRCKTPCSRSTRQHAALLQRVAPASDVTVAHHEHNQCGSLPGGGTTAACGTDGLCLPHMLHAFFSARLIRVQRSHVHAPLSLSAWVESGSSSEAACGYARPRFLVLPTGKATCAATGG